MNFPVLETERLILRMWRNEDFETYAEMCADLEVMRFLGGKTMTRLEAWRHMGFLIGHWMLRGYGHFAVEEKSSGRFIGRIGFLNPEGWPGFEMGPRIRDRRRASRPRIWLCRTRSAARHQPYSS
jgi:RimJ/RimL family protein N-acetyltransferase